MSRVIVGEGKPRFVVITTAVVTTTIQSLNNELKLAYLAGSPILTSTVLNKFLYSKNSSDEETKGKIIQYDNDNDFVKVEGWDNGFPVEAEEAIIKDKVIDLPYSREIAETFEPVFKQPKILYHNRKKIRDLAGFYYFATVDYSNYSKRSMLEVLADIYDSTRGSSFYFYPRSDNKNVVYECEIDGEEYFRIAQHIRSQGHKYVKIALEGLSLLTQIPLSQSVLDLGVNQLIVQDDQYKIEVEEVEV